MIILLYLFHLKIFKEMKINLMNEFDDKLKEPGIGY